MTNTYAVILTFANGTLGRFSPLNYSRNVASYFSTNIKLIIAIDAYTIRYGLNGEKGPNPFWIYEPGDPEYEDEKILQDD